MNDQHTLLYKWFKATFSDNYLRDEKAEGLLQLIVTNQNYTPQFWCIQDEEGNSPLQWLVNNTSVDLKGPLEYVLYDTNVAHFVFNTPNQKQRVILHDLWTKYKKRYDNSLGGHLLTVVDQTNKNHWTFWDAQGQSPGEGWIAQILQQQSSHNGSSVLNTLSQKIIDVFPPVLNQDPSNSPWLTIKSAAQAQTLLDSGYNLYDTVAINNWEQPAWRLLLMCHGKHLFSNEMVDSLTQEDQNEYNTLSEKYSSWQTLVPHDRRAKIGYVRQVLEKTGVDFLGQNSLVYLLNHRSDLLALLHRELVHTCKIADAAKWVGQTDAAGYTLLAHAMFRGDLKEVAALYKSLEMPLSLGVGSSGWFSHEKKSSVWFENVLSSGRNNITSIRGLQTFLLVSQDPSALYGDHEQQKQLSDEWEKILMRLPSLATSFNHRSNYGASKVSSKDEFFFRQALLFIEHESMIAPALIPELAAQLKVAGIWARSMAGLNEHWNLRIEGSKLRIEDISPIEYATPGIQEFVEKDGVTQMFRTAYNKNTLIEKWTVSTQRAVLLNNIETQPTSSFRRKM